MIGEETASTLLHIYQNTIFCTSKQLLLHLISEHPQTSSELATTTVLHSFFFVAIWDKSGLHAKCNSFGTFILFS